MVSRESPVRDGLTDLMEHIPKREILEFNRDIYWVGEPDRLETSPKLPYSSTRRKRVPKKEETFGIWIISPKTD